MLADGQDRPAGGVGLGDREDAVVRPCGEVDDHVVDRRQGGGQRGHRPERDDLAPRATHEIGEAGRPDEVVRQDGDSRRQSSISARWWKTSRAVTTPVGRPSSMIGI